MKRHGKVVAADSTERTITIQCDDKIGGVVMGSRIVLDDEWPESTPEPIFKSTLESNRFERQPGE